MAVKSKYEWAVAAFIAAKVRLYKPGTTWPEYAAAIEESDSAWRTLVVVAAGEAANAVEI